MLREGSRIVAGIRSRASSIGGEHPPSTDRPGGFRGSSERGRWFSGRELRRKKGVARRHGVVLVLLGSEPRQEEEREADGLMRERTLLVL